MSDKHTDASRDMRDFEKTHGRPMTVLERNIFRAMQTIPAQRRLFPDLVLPVIMPIIEEALEVAHEAGFAEHEHLVDLG